MEQLQNLEQEGLTGDTLAMLEAAPEQLKPALQLAVHSILFDHVRLDSQGQKHAAFYDNETDALATLAVTAEALATLIPVAANSLQSPFLRERLLALSNGMLAQHLLATTEQGENQFEDIRTLLWTEKAIESLPLIDTAVAKENWYQHLRATLAGARENWDKSR